MKASVFKIHESLRVFPPAQGAYILYRRILEQGLMPTWLWIKDKIVRRTQGFSIPELSEVAPYLYVGGQHRRQALDRMRELGITAILNLREESDDAARGLVLDAYLWLPITDDTAPSVEEFSRGVAFIEEQISQGRGVYVHCASGVGRAPTMAAAYFVSCGTEPQEAWDIIRRTRPFVRPTPPQLDIVRKFARDPGSAASKSA
ncbi:MAG: protein-tyrosine phosphatase family protein, partial [Anaerolineae bacterium]